MNALGFLALGYGIVWIIIGGYVWYISARERALRRRLAQLEAEIGEIRGSRREDQR